MPQCSIIVHHGGCGTTAASLRAGKPTVITPVAFDQWYFGDQVKRKGVGTRTEEQVARLTASSLAATLRTCQSETVKNNAAALGQRLRKEDGALYTAKWIAAYMKAEVATGRWKASVVAAATNKRKEKDLAVGRPATASSSKSAERAPSFAVDGQAWTRWTSTYADEQWLSVDLGETLKVSSVEICWEKAHAKTYSIQTWDGKNWRTLADERGAQGWVVTKLRPGTTARWIRMYGHKRATEWGFSIWEMKVYG